MLDQIGHVDQFQIDAQIGLVGTVAAHRLGVRHARELRGQFHPDHVAEHMPHHVFGQVLHIALGHPRKFHVELGEFQLAVGAQRFVAEAAGDLVIAIETGHHQNLLEQLRALRQRVELAGVHARRHQKITRTFRRGLGQDGSFDVLETTRIQVMPQRRHQLGACPQLALHLGAAQVEVAVLQADVLARVLVVVERQRLGLVQQLDRLGHHFHLAGPDLVVHRLPATHRAGDAQAVFVAHCHRCGQHASVTLAVCRFGDDLHDTFMVAQVDKHDLAHIAGDIGPAAQGDGLADQRLVDQAAEMGTHGDSGEVRAGGHRQANHFNGFSRPTWWRIWRLPAWGSLTWHWHWLLARLWLRQAWPHRRPDCFSFRRLS